MGFALFNDRPAVEVTDPGKTPDNTRRMNEASTPPAASRRLRGSAAFLAGLALLGLLGVTAARRARPGPRLAGNARLVDLIRLQDRRTATLRGELEALRGRLAALEQRAATGRRQVADLRRAAAALEPFAGLAAIEGPGVRVELRDSTLRESPTGDPNDLVVHEQDLQAVVNALWAGGAEGVSVNGERVTSLSAIRCVGNTLLLHGSVYSPPYRVAAIGDPGRLMQALDDDEGVERLRIVAEKFRLGYDADRMSRIALPAFRGLTALRFARIA